MMAMSKAAREAMGKARALRVAANPLEARPAPDAWRGAPFYVACIRRGRRGGVPGSAELAARDEALALGLAAIAPVGMRQVRKRRADGRVGRGHCLEPALLFPGYLLVGVVSGGPRLSVLYRSRRVSGMLGHDGVPVRVAQGEVVRLIDSLNARAYDEAACEGARRPVFEAGDIVDILDGPFEGWRGRVGQGNQGDGRMRGTAGVVLAFMGAERLIEIPVDSLRVPGAAIGQDDRD